MLPRFSLAPLVVPSFWRHQSITAGVIFPAADATAQLFDKNKGGEESSAGGAIWDFYRTLRWLFFGFAVQAPWNHVSWSFFFSSAALSITVAASARCSIESLDPKTTLTGLAYAAMCVTRSASLQHYPCGLHFLRRYEQAFVQREHHRNHTSPLCPTYLLDRFFPLCVQRGMLPTNTNRANCTSCTDV